MLCVSTCVQTRVSMLPLEGVAKHWQTPCYRTGNAQVLECRLMTLHVPPLFCGGVLVALQGLSPCFHWC